MEKVECPHEKCYGECSKSSAVIYIPPEAWLLSLFRVISTPTRWYVNLSRPSSLNALPTGSSIAIYTLGGRGRQSWKSENKT